MTNFDFLASPPSFSSFVGPAMAAGKIYAIDPTVCVTTCICSLSPIPAQPIQRLPLASHQYLKPFL